MLKSLKMCCLYSFLGPYGLERDTHDFATFSLDRGSRVLGVGHLRFREDCSADFKPRPVLQNLVAHGLAWILVEGLLQFGHPAVALSALALFFCVYLGCATAETGLRLP